MINAYKLGVFFQKHNSRLWRIVWVFFRKVFLRSNERRVDFFRAQGATIGANVNIDWDTIGTEPYLVEIGDNTYFSGGARCVTHDGGIMQLMHIGLTEKMYDVLGKIRIGANCFIGTQTIILKNVTIGDNCIIGAGSVVSKSVPSGSVAAGVPARVIETVEEYYEKNKAFFDDTIGWKEPQKRQYVKNNMEKYERIRIDRSL